MISSNINYLKNKDFKVSILFVIILIFGLTLILRLFFLQIFEYKTYDQRAQYSTSRISILTAPRGIIYDRNGKILATNKQSISVIVYPNKLKSKEERLKVYSNLSKILKDDSSKIKKIFLKLPEDAALPVRLVSSISVEEAIQIVEKQFLLPGISIQEEPIRYYPNNSLASHVIGYISQINENELNKRPDRRLGDLVGKYGIEKVYDDVLHGVDGKRIVAVDRFGKPIDPDFKSGLINLDTVPGKDIQLTIDLDLQKVAEEALKDAGNNSAAVVVNPNTGEVLALASYPNFDPNVFTKPINESTWSSLLSKKAFLNRAILGFVPGSIWKPVTLIAALDSMVVKPNEKFNVSGAYYLGSTRFGDWTSKTGTLSLVEALAWSRDTAFYQIGRRLKPEQIRKWGVKLGGGRKTGVELLGEEKGIIPDEKWKKKYVGEPWYPGNTLHYAIGQSFLLITPIQAARIYSSIATGSIVPKLHLIKRVDKYHKEVKQTEKYTIDQDLLQVVKDGLFQCVQSGTGGASRLEKVHVAGKTGSAEVPGSHKTHGWFVAYAPVENPEITVAIIAEKAGHGGSIAAPIAKKILESYFKNKFIPPVEEINKNIKDSTKLNATPQPLQKEKKKKRLLGKLFH